jgi:2-keto-myo-inositol isomerase
LLNLDNLAFVQLADLAGVPRELATDADRVLPGDGDFRFGPILEHLRKMKYAGYISIELMNPTLWNTPASQVVELARMAMDRLLGDHPTSDRERS